jgi:hypothetical protein
MDLAIALPSVARVGRPVTIGLRLLNAGDTAAEVVLQGRPPAFDIRITQADGRPVWRRLEGEVVTLVLQLRRLEPGESLALTHVWDQRNAEGAQVPPGEYVVTADLPADPPAVFRAGPVRLTIVP